MSLVPFGLSGTLDNIPPCVLESAGCLNIAVVSSAAEARCCQTSDDRRQEQSPETGLLATQGTPTVWGTGGLLLKVNFINYSLHPFINNFLFTYNWNYNYNATIRKW